jgi:hypothetical protein
MKGNSSLRKISCCVKKFSVIPVCEICKKIFLICTCEDNELDK